MAESSHDAALFVDAHRVELIGRVRKVWPIASALLLKGVARNRWLLLMNSSCQEQMRELYRDLDAGGEAVKATFYTLLKEHEPRLLQELESRGEQREDELRKDRGRKQEEKREAETAAEREEKAKRREEEAKRREEEVENQRAEMERRRESLEREREEILREREELEKMREETQRQREELERRMEEEKQKKREKCKLPLKKVYSLDILPPNIGEEPLQVAPPPPREPELRLLLLGRSGAGKSTVGNAMLPGDGPAPPTLISQRRRGSIAGRQVCVVNTPDWFRPGLSPEEMRRDVGVSIKLCAPGPHAFLLLLPLHQPEQEGRDTVQKMVEIFGEGCLGHTLILLTHRNELRDGTVREHVQNQDLRGVLEKCGNRHQLFRMDRPDITQVTDLLEKIKEMVAGNTEEFYSSEMYQEVELQVKELEEKIKREREERKEREEREMKERYERELQESLRKMEGVIQEREEKIRTLEERIEELETELREE
ncbi:GTPase IMAP family member 4-like, partial [Megalops cyprinoides]|uniref:GTPase IMAP family member 4-like n=1 Tax=Megalops cyprinoides TaxID=118141 RepID=UPI001863D228